MANNISANTYYQEISEAFKKLFSLEVKSMIKEEMFGLKTVQAEDTSNQPALKEELFTAKEVCTILKIGRTSLWAATKSFEIGHYDIGKRNVRYSREHINAYLKTYKKYNRAK